MSKITNGGLTRSGTGRFTAVPILVATVDVKGLTCFMTLFLDYICRFSEAVTCSAVTRSLLDRH